MTSLVTESVTVSACMWVYVGDLISDVAAVSDHANLKDIFN